MDYAVSVIMSTYREREEHLRLAVESILNQTYSDFEFILVVDDPENVQLRQILAEYAEKDARIKLYVNDVNRGLTYSRNRCFSYCTGKYIAIMDADDISEPKRLEVQKEYLDMHPELDITFTGRTEINEQNEVITPFKGSNLQDEKIPDILEFGSIITNPSVMMRADCLKQLNGLREVSHAEDYDLWLRCCDMNYRFHLINEALLKYRIRGDSLSHKNYAYTWVSTQYARTLHKRRRKSSTDNFSEADAKKFIEHSVRRSEKSTERFNKYYDLFMSGVNSVKSGNRLGGAFKILKAFFCNKELIVVFYVYARLKIALKNAGTD